MAESIQGAIGYQSSMKVLAPIRLASKPVPQQAEPPSLLPREIEVLGLRLASTSVQEIGKLLGITEPRVCQILMSATEKLRAATRKTRIGLEDPPARS